jgi:hypothetical protein
MLSGTCSSLAPSSGDLHPPIAWSCVRVLSNEDYASLWCLTLPDAHAARGERTHASPVGVTDRTQRAVRRLSRRTIATFERYQDAEALVNRLAGEDSRLSGMSSWAGTSNSSSG